MNEVRLDLILDASDVLRQISEIEEALQRLQNIEIKIKGLDEAIGQAKQLQSILTGLNQTLRPNVNMHPAMKQIQDTQTLLSQLSKQLITPQAKPIVDVASFAQQMKLMEQSISRLSEKVITPVAKPQLQTSELAKQISEAQAKLVNLNIQASMPDLAKLKQTIRPEVDITNAIEQLNLVETRLSQLSKQVITPQAKPSLDITSISKQLEQLDASVGRLAGKVISPKVEPHLETAQLSKQIQEAQMRLSQISSQIVAPKVKPLQVPVDIDEKSIEAQMRKITPLNLSAMIEPRIAGESLKNSLSDAISHLVARMSFSMQEIKSAKDLYERMMYGFLKPPTTPPTITAYKYFDFDRERFRRSMQSLMDSVYGTVNFRTIAGLYMFNAALSNFSTRFGGIFEDAVKNFEQTATSLQKIRIVTGTSSSVYNRMVNDIRRLAGDVMMPFASLAEIGYAFATRGYAEPSRIAEVLRPLAIASLITGETLDTMARSILSLMQAWNPAELSELRLMAPSLVKSFADIMTYAYAKSPLEVRWFKDIANYVAPLFAHFGYSIEETLALFMGMAQTLPTPGIGARSMRMLLFNILNPERGLRVLEQFGINPTQIFTSYAKAGKTLVDAFEELFRQIKRLPSELRAALFRQIGGGVRGGMAAAMMMNEDVLRNMRRYIRNLELQSIGFTTYAQLQYRYTPIGMYQSAQARLEAALSALGQNIIGVKTALLNLTSQMVNLLTKLPAPLAGGLYGSTVGARFAAEWIIPTITNLAILSYITQLTGATTKSTLLSALTSAAPFIIKGGLALSLATILGTAGVMAYQVYAQKREQKMMEEFYNRFRDWGTLETAAYALRHAFEKHFFGKVTYEIPAPEMYSAFTMMTTERNKHWFRLTKEQFAALTGALGDVGNLLRYSLLKTIADITESADSTSSLTYRSLKNQILPLINEYVGAFSELPKGINWSLPQDVRGALAMVFGGTRQEVTKAAQEFVSAYESIKATFGKNISDELATSFVIALAGAAALGKEAKMGDKLFTTLNSLLGTKLTLEDIKTLVELIANTLNARSLGTEGPNELPTQQEPSYAQLLDIWLRGLLPYQELRHQLPSLKNGDISLYRTWKPYHYSETVAVLTPAQRNLEYTAAYLDMAFRPGTLPTP